MRVYSAMSSFENGKWAIKFQTLLRSQKEWGQKKGMCHVHLRHFVRRGCLDKHIEKVQVHCVIWVPIMVNYGISPICPGILKRKGSLLHSAWQEALLMWGLLCGGFTSFSSSSLQTILQDAFYSTNTLIFGYRKFIRILWLSCRWSMVIHFQNFSIW